MQPLEPFTITEADGAIDVLFSGTQSPLSFRTAESFRSAMKTRYKLSDQDIDQVLEHRRFERMGVGRNTEVEKVEFRALSERIRKDHKLTWPAFSQILSLNRSVDPRRLVEDGGSKPTLMILRSKAIELLGERQVQAIRDDIMRARTQNGVEAESEHVEEVVASVAATKPAEPKLPHEPPKKPELFKKISLREDLPIFEGRRGLSNAGAKEKKETNLIVLFLREHRGLDYKDIARLAGYPSNALGVNGKRPLPRQRLDLLKKNVLEVLKVDVDGMVFQGEYGDRYRLGGSAKPKTNGNGASLPAAAAIEPPQVENREPSFDELMTLAAGHIRDARTCYEQARAKVKGAVAKAVGDILETVKMVADQIEDEGDQPAGAT